VFAEARRDRFTPIAPKEWTDLGKVSRRARSVEQWRQRLGLAFSEWLRSGQDQGGKAL